MTTYFDKQNSICSDSCWEESKKYGNQKINDYQTYSTQLFNQKCSTHTVNTNIQHK